MTDLNCWHVFFQKFQNPSVSGMNPLIDDCKNFIFILPMFLWQILGKDVARMVTSFYALFQILFS